MAFDLDHALRYLIAAEGSDLHLKIPSYPLVRLHGSLEPIPGTERLFPEDTQKALDRATPFLRRQIGSRVQLRRVPELEFRFDESIANQDRIEQILRDIHQEDAQRVSEDESRASSPDDDRNGD